MLLLGVKDRIGVAYFQGSSNTTAVREPRKDSLQNRLTLPNSRDEPAGGFATGEQKLPYW